MVKSRSMVIIASLTERNIASRFERYLFNSASARLKSVMALPELKVP